MRGEVDFTKGGYGGDPFEERFKYFTVPHMEYWWQFREVLRAGDESQDYWIDREGNVLGEEAQRELIALSLINHAVYLAISEALTFTEEMRRMTDIGNAFDARKAWKAVYSSMYTSLAAISNIVYVLVKQTSVWKRKSDGTVTNYSFRETIDLIETKKPDEQLLNLLKSCDARLDIRHHLDHYWTINVAFWPGHFYMDSDFKKGKVPLKRDEIVANTSIPVRTYSDMVGMAEDYNAIYKILSLKGAYLDKFLDEKEWKVDYSKFGEPHNGQRPVTKADKK